jgi:RHS repeat-associated protein
LGSAVRLTNETGDPVQSIAYAPFGETVLYSGIKDPKYQFTGQENDTQSGLYYYGARYYCPEIGRFIQPDTILDGLNRYAYCRNNPMNYIDPTGMDTVDDSEESKVTAQNDKGQSSSKPQEAVVPYNIYGEKDGNGGEDSKANGNEANKNNNKADEGKTKGEYGFSNLTANRGQNPNKSSPTGPEGKESGPNGNPNNIKSF